MTGRTRQRTRLAIAVALSIALVALAGKRIDFAEVGRVLDGAAPWPITAAAGLAVSICIMASNLRLWLLMTALPATGKRVGLCEHTRLYYASCAMHQLLPGPSAEILRVLHLRRHGYTFGALVSGQLIDRAIDGFALALAAAALAAQAPPLVRRSLLGFAAVVVAAIAVALLLARWLPPAPALARWSAALRQLRAPRLWIAGVGLSLVDVVANAATLALAAAALHVHVTLAASFTAMLAARFASLLPALPGQFGVAEAGVIAALVAFGVDRDRALAVGLIFHLVHLIPITIVGLWQLHRLRATAGSYGDGAHRPARADDSYR